MSDTVKITINEVELDVPRGELIVESAKRIGVEIPIFCYHPRLTPVGMCRMCLVEVGTKQPDGTVRKMPKPQTACTLPASDNMVVFTDTEQIQRDRRGIVEFLLINHPLDCPICDRGGECPLQNNTLFYGPGVSRFSEDKRHEVKAFPLSDYVVLDRERCIHCARCTRFTEEISGDAQLGFLFRGASMRLSTFEDTRFTSKFSGNVIEVCPVGALTNRKYRFRARPWDLQTQKTICTECSNGCSVFFDHRLDRLVRIDGRTNEHVNEEWTCDRGKFGQEYVSGDRRLEQPLIRQDGELRPATWSQAFGLVAERMRTAVSLRGGSSVAGLGGERTTNEDNWMFQKLFRAGLKSNNLDHRMSRFTPAFGDPVSGMFRMPTAIADIEAADTIFLFGGDFAVEQPMLYLRARKAWLKNGASVVVAHSQQTDADAFAQAILRYEPGSEVALIGGILRQMLDSTTIVEGLNGIEKLRDSLAEFTLAWVTEQTGVDASAVARAAKAMNSPNTVILAGSAVQNHVYWEAITSALSNVAVLTGSVVGGRFGLNLPTPKCNTQGAADMGILPDALPGYRPLSDAGAFVERWGTDIPTAPGMNTRAILEAAFVGDIECLYLLGCNPLTGYHDTGLARRALDACDFVIVQDILQNELLEFADVVLPAAAFPERTGTYTNTERRIQRTYQAYPALNGVKEDWTILAELLMRLQTASGLRPVAPPFNPKEVMKEISSLAPVYEGAEYDRLPDDGFRWSAAPIAQEPRLESVEYRVPAIRL